MVDSAGRAPVASLLGHAQVELAILCLGSLLRFSAEPLALRLHDDGTLTRADADQLAAALEGCEIVWRCDADARMEAILAGYPRLRDYRRQSPLALKLLDVAAWADRELFYCDSDVLFFRPFRALFSRPPDASLFMSDRQNAYSVRSWDLLLHRRLDMPSGVNTGIIAFLLARHDLELVEWYLAHPAFRFAPVWVEQTCWALLAGRNRCCLLEPSQLTIPVPGRQPVKDCIGAHFVGAVRGCLPHWREALAEPVDNGAPETFRSREAAPCTPARLAVTEARRVLGRWRRGSR